MSDVEFVCSQCGDKILLSEFAEKIPKCARCGNPDLKRAGGRPSLSPVNIARGGPRRDLKGDVIETRAAADPMPVRGVENFRKQAASRVGKEGLPSAILGWIVFLVFAVPFGLLLFGARTSPQWMDIHRQARWGGVAVPFLIVVIEGFRESSWRGLLCFFPPYLLWHALTRVESYWRQSLVMGALALLMSEYFLLKDVSMVAEIGASVSRGIESVSGLIRRAGEAGDLK